MVATKKSECGEFYFRRMISIIGFSQVNAGVGLLRIHNNMHDVLYSGEASEAQ